MSSPRTAGHPRPALGTLLRLAAHVMAEDFARWIAVSGYEGIQPAHSAAIQPLWERREGARITALARASRVTKQSMSKLVSDLEAAGYVERIADPDDARAVRIRLTARGRSYGKAARDFARSIEKTWAARIGERRVAQLCDTLERLRTDVFLAD
jgi:DNA-binding MarR family transcriptional regulator